jgi:eukaryotic-like serine/threonine-protein kinase
MKLMQPGEKLDGFVIGECIHSGGMAHIYTVHFDQGRPDPGFPMIMKVPRMTAGDGAENIIGFEIEAQILSVLRGTHVPRFVAAGDLTRLPYLVMEYVQGKTLQHWLDHAPPVPERDLQQICHLGAALAHAVHSLHKQNTCHLDLKPANALQREDGSVVLLDFGLSSHAHYPDLLAEEMRKAVGSPTWISPEQVVGVRGDPRSDVFALGVILYEMCTGELPFGSPATAAGMRQRLWMQPRPLRQRRADIPAWLQEIILKCLEPHADHRYPSAAHVAFDLTHPTQVVVGERGHALKGLGFGAHFKRWIRAAGMHYQPSPLPTQQITQVPIVMVAVPYRDVKDETLYALRQATGRALGSRPGARLACVTVISPNETSSTDSTNSETQVHRQHLAMLMQWAQGLDLHGHQASYHVLEASDVAQAILNYASGNHVNIIVMGAATHGVRMQHFLATVPIKVAMDAPCTVMLVKQELPFAMLGDMAQETADLRANA